ncbi:GTPase-associated system all-helical protein GASH [Bradyrhizobium sp. BWA-3-5]|uniref:GTPase-associated system all-helical protein GASH n=1 Tax=Bradyrhizobium sp. BWA-3-5 TaxID=3080013 RepID=UPI00293E45F3|nr:GTPase-associated system all-helical protein GASH [Bradyrhizobium sp. BWA-3-5]WOH68867.1 GTPase-associated system all-helical protein GASH [Bradyrhizobium sp. BWA-3-5]
MLSKVFEWSRIVHPAPEDDFVAKRTAVVTALVEAFSTDSGRRIDCACIAAAGVTARFAQDTPIISEVIAAIKNEQPATPEAIGENAMNLRSCCALIVGELAERQRKKGGSSADCDAMAAIVLAALANRRPPSERHLREMLAELLEICKSATKSSAGYRHQRWSLPRYINNIKEAGDVPAFWTEAKKHFLHLANSIEANEQVTREELDTLWWAFNGTSTSTETSFADMPAGLAALDGATELSGLVLLPPLPNTPFLLNRVLKVGRRPEDLEEQNLKDLLGHWDKAAAERCVTDDANVAALVQGNPAVFPISWACRRMAEDNSFLSDMKKATGWDPAGKIRPDRLAFQIFQEKIAQRLYKNITE